MTAADRLAMDALKAFLLSHVRRVALVITLGVIVALAYCGGVTHGKETVTASVHDSLRRVQAQELAQISRHRDSTAKVAASTERAAMQTHTKYVAARKPVKLISDTVIRVASDDPAIVSRDVNVLPEITALIRRADSTIIADSIAFRAQAAVLVDVTHERDVWKARAENDETELRELKHARRFGIKTGIALGVSVTALLVHLLK